MRAKVLGPKDGKFGDLVTLGVRFMVGGEESGGGFALVEHPLPPRGARRADASPQPRGRVQLRARGPRRRAAWRGGRVRRVGDLIFKPRTSGTRSGTTATSRRGSSRSSRPPVSSASSTSSPSPSRRTARARRCPSATASSSTSTASPGCSSATACRSARPRRRSAARGPRRRAARCTRARPGGSRAGARAPRRVALEHARGRTANGPQMTPARSRMSGVSSTSTRRRSSGSDRRRA